jgi:phosphohistidine phosphatase
MKLYLMQHGRPVAKEDNPDRPLSDQGEKDVEKVAGFLNRHGIRVDEAFHSGKTRARQTAEIMISKLHPGLALAQRDGLSPLDDVKDIANHIKVAKKDLIIVGHLPHLGRLVSLLITGSESVPVVSFQQGGVVCLEKDAEGLWSVVWMLGPEIL